MSTTGRGRGTGEGEPPTAPPIPSFASLREPRRSSPAMDVLAPPPAAVRPRGGSARTAAPSTAPVAPRPAEWPDLIRFGVRVAQAALRLPGAIVREPARRLLRALGE